MSITKAPDCRFHTVHSRRGLEDLGDVECLTPDPEVLGVSWHPTVLEVLAALFFTTVTRWNSILAASSSCGVKPEKSSFPCVCPHVIAVGLVDAATLAVYAALTGFTVWVMSASLLDSTVFRESATGSQAPVCWAHIHGCEFSWPYQQVHSRHVWLMQVHVCCHDLL